MNFAYIVSLYDDGWYTPIVAFPSEEAAQALVDSCQQYDKDTPTMRLSKVPFYGENWTSLQFSPGVRAAKNIYEADKTDGVFLDESGQLCHDLVYRTGKVNDWNDSVSKSRDTITV